MQIGFGLQRQRPPTYPLLCRHNDSVVCFIPPLKASVQGNGRKIAPTREKTLLTRWFHRESVTMPDQWAIALTKGDHNGTDNVPSGSPRNRSIYVGLHSPGPPPWWPPESRRSLFWITEASIGPSWLHFPLNGLSPRSSLLMPVSSWQSPRVSFLSSFYFVLFFATRRQNSTSSVTANISFLLV